MPPVQQAFNEYDGETLFDESTTDTDDLFAALCNTSPTDYPMPEGYDGERGLVKQPTVSASAPEYGRPPPVRVNPPTLSSTQAEWEDPFEEGEYTWAEQMYWDRDAHSSTVDSVLNKLEDLETRWISGVLDDNIRLERRMSHASASRTHWKRRAEAAERSLQTLQAEAARAAQAKQAEQLQSVVPGSKRKIDVIS
jgi:hypothetical protein